MTQPPTDPEEPLGGALTPQPADQPEPDAADGGPGSGQGAGADVPVPPAGPATPAPPSYPQAPSYPPPPGYPSTNAAQSGAQPPAYPQPGAGYPPPPPSGAFPPPPSYPTPAPGAFPPPPAYTSAFPPGPAAAKPNNYLVPAILATIFCCMPLGIVAIVKAAKVDGLFQSAQYAAADQASAEAKKWTFWSVGIGVAVLAVYALFVVVGALASSN